MTPEITLAVTSCGRYDLLERTLRSFARYSAGLISDTVIVEDSDRPVPKWLPEIENVGPKCWIANGSRKAQVYSCDRAMAEVKTPYVFWCEDDWEFFRRGFIEESLEILEKWPKVLQVWLRDDSSHPVVTDPRFPFPIMQPNWSGGWSGFAFNPGLRRLSEYRKIGSYGRHVGYDARKVGELHLSRLYHEMGYVAAKIPGATRHIGEGNRHITWATDMPKVLVAIPACHRYEYGQLAHGIQRQTEDRLAAQRATWLQGAPAFSSYVDCKFFFGRGATRMPEPDEVFLDCPDDYLNLPHKMQAIYRWALAHGFAFVYKCDDDTFVYLDRLLASGFEHYDYTGYIVEPDEVRAPRSYISGGAGYWLSRRALEHLAQEEIDHWAEDLWTGRVMAKHGIRPHRDPRYLPGFEKHYVDLDALPENHAYISFHACTPEMMKRLHEANPSPVFQFADHAMGEPARKRGATPQLRESYQQFPAIIRRSSNDPVPLRILVAILACHQRTVGPEAQRRTWLKDAAKFGLEYRFFLGAPPKPQGYDPRRPKLAMEALKATPRARSDEVWLEVPDTYPELPQKTRELIRWAYYLRYDFIFKCDDDTYVAIERLLKSGFEKHDYYGFRRAATWFGPGKEVEHAQGGAGYWLSRQAMEIVLAHDQTMQGAEDINVARVLREHGIEAVHDPRYQPAMTSVPMPSNQQITAHDCSAEDMFEIYQRFQFDPSAARPSGLSTELSECGMERVLTPQAVAPGRVS